MWLFGREFRLRNNSNTPKEWQNIRFNFNFQTHQALLQQHHAVQLIAIAGKYLIDEKADDSHTNMTFISQPPLFKGNKFKNEMCLALDADQFSLQLLDDSGEVLNQFSLVGKTQEEAFVRMRQILSDAGLGIRSLQNKLHYTIPDHPIQYGAVFQVENQLSLMQNNIYRHNAEIVLVEVFNDFELDAEINVWPHHFDTGAFLPLEFDGEKNLLKYIGLGFAIPDTMVSEPYFYLSFWSKNNIEELKNPPSLNRGKWMNPNWDGAVLTVSEIAKEQFSDQQFQIVNEFYHAGLNILKPFFNF